MRMIVNKAHNHAKVSEFINEIFGTNNLLIKSYEKNMNRNMEVIKADLSFERRMR